MRVRKFLKPLGTFAAMFFGLLLIAALTDSSEGGEGAKI